MTSAETITGVGVIVAAGLGVASILHATCLQRIEHRNEQARRIGDWLSKVLTSVGGAVTFPEIFEPILKSEHPLPDFSRVTLGFVQQCHKGQLLCISLVNDKVAMLSTSPEIKNRALRQAINDVAKEVEIIAKTFVEYRDRFAEFAPTREFPVELLNKFVPEMRERVDAMQRSSNLAAGKLEKFLSGKHK